MTAFQYAMIAILVWGVFYLSQPILDHVLEMRRIEHQNKLTREEHDRVLAKNEREQEESHERLVHNLVDVLVEQLWDRLSPQSPTEQSHD